MNDSGSDMMRLKNIKVIKGKVRLVTGLHIGAGDTGMHIGGTDQEVVKNPKTGEPYIPGSSLKGKMRSLLEYKAGVKEKPLSMSSIGENGSDEEKKLGVKIVKIFGSSDENGKEPTRISVSDCFILRESFKNDRIPFTEIKAENSINRRTGTAGSPRFIERVIPGVEFDLTIALKIFEGDEEDLIDTVVKGLALLEKDYLGGNGSRGYGKVEFELKGELNAKLAKERNGCDGQSKAA